MTSVLDGAVVRPAGEAAVVLEYGDRIDPVLHDRVLAVDIAIRAAALAGVVEVVPSYRSVLLHLDPLATTPEDVVAALNGVIAVDRGVAGRRHEVAIDPTHGEDLDEVARQCGLDGAAAVVDALVDIPLRLYLHGFAPGFAYLGGVPEQLHVPRRATPRPPVAPGSVLLAAGQLALCPVAMPTGWWVVGRTDVALFDPDRDPPVPFAAGDEVRLRRSGS